MKSPDFTEYSDTQNISSSLQEELKQIDNIVESKFHNRVDNSINRDKKVINKIKLLFYNNDFELPDERHKKQQIDILLSVIGKNYKKEKFQTQFKPLVKPKKVSLKGKVLINNNIIINNNSALIDGKDILV